MAGDTITLTEGTDWCANYRRAYPGANKAYLYDKDILIELLSQEGCDGMRIYNAIDDEDNACVVLVGVDTDGDDMTGGVILDRGDPCPQTCDINSPLNTSE